MNKDLYNRTVEMLNQFRLSLQEGQDMPSEADIRSDVHNATEEFISQVLNQSDQPADKTAA